MTSHPSFKCFQRPKPKTKPKVYVDNEWLKTRKRWKKLNPPTHEGYYFCHYCGRPMTEDEMTLDHRIPRSRAHNLKYSLSNLVECCYPCNSEKGSIHYDDFIKKKNPRCSRG